MKQKKNKVSKNNVTEPNKGTQKTGKKSTKVADKGNSSQESGGENTSSTKSNEKSEKEQRLENRIAATTERDERIVASLKTIAEAEARKKEKEENARQKRSAETSPGLKKKLYVHKEPHLEKRSMQTGNKET